MTLKCVFRSDFQEDLHRNRRPQKGQALFISSDFREEDEEVLSRINEFELEVVEASIFISDLCKMMCFSVLEMRQPPMESSY